MAALPGTSLILLLLPHNSQVIPLLPEDGHGINVQGNTPPQPRMPPQDS